MIPVDGAALLRPPLARNCHGIEFLGFLEPDPKLAALPDGRFQPDRPVHSFHRLADDRQTNAGPIIVFRPLNPGENTPDPCMVHGVDANAIILNP